MSISRWPRIWPPVCHSLYWLRSTHFPFHFSLFFESSKLTLITSLLNHLARQWTIDSRFDGGDFASVAKSANLQVSVTLGLPSAFGTGVQKSPWWYYDQAKLALAHFNRASTRRYLVLDCWRWISSMYASFSLSKITYLKSPEHLASKNQPQSTDGYLSCAWCRLFELQLWVCSGPHYRSEILNPDR